MPAESIGEDIAWEVKLFSFKITKRNSCRSDPRVVLERLADWNVDGGGVRLLDVELVGKPERKKATDKSKTSKDFVLETWSSATTTSEDCDPKRKKDSIR